MQNWQNYKHQINQFKDVMFIVLLLKQTPNVNGWYQQLSYIETANGLKFREVPWGGTDPCHLEN